MCAVPVGFRQRLWFLFFSIIFFIIFLFLYFSLILSTDVDLQLQQVYSYNRKLYAVYYLDHPEICDSSGLLI